MKPFLEVEANRKSYHSDGARNSVHRSSLLVPNIPGTQAEVSFLNHFLLRRSLKKVGCRITAVDAAGRRIESRLFDIDEPRVYSFPLTTMFPETAQNFMVEFFAPENLFIPFSAAMVNHHGENFVNGVHSFNRILNDAFEDDEINAVHQMEAAIDVEVSDARDTFIVFMSGAQPVQDKLELRYLREGQDTVVESLDLDMPKLGRQIMDLGKVMPALGQDGLGTLKVMQPKQFLFYGRMLIGRRAQDGAFIAHHSYYDCSGIKEYWPDNRPALRLYPFFASLENRVRFYPIMSPGELRISAACMGRNGEELLREEIGTVTSPNGTPLDVSIDTLIARNGISRAEVTSYALFAAPVSGNTPTRVSHQIFCGAPAADALYAAVNMSLSHPAIFRPTGKPSYVWGQAVIGHDTRAWIGICGLMPDGPAAEVELTVYGESGELLRRTLKIPAGAGCEVDFSRDCAAELGDLLDGPRTSIWYEAKSTDTALYGISFTQHRHSCHTTGEHNF